MDVAVWRVASSALALALILLPLVVADELQERAAAVLEQAAEYWSTRLSCRGGYLWRYSEDLSRWEGEGEAAPNQIWVQPPGTPTVGDAFLQAYRLTGDRRLLECAKAAADALIWGQLETGGWDYKIDFFGEDRWAYRHETSPDPSDYRVCTFDDDVTQSATELLMEVASVLGCDPYAESARFALEFILESQFPNGAWPQRYPLTGSYPNYYSDFYTFNDGVINDCEEGDEYDHDQDGYTSATYGGDDCDDADPAIYPGAPGYDDDCQPIQEDTGDSSRDTGEPTWDTGEPTWDTGEPTWDTGEPTLDTGEPTGDTGGSTSDSGAPNQDTGGPTWDSGAPSQDTGQGAVAKDGGGCGCSPTPGVNPAAILLLLSSLGLVLRRRT